MTLSFVELMVELGVLYFLSQSVVHKLFSVFIHLFRSHSVSVSLMTALLFPGTVIHELSHLFTAEILGVRTGKLTLVPETIREEHEIQTGSVAISQTDPLRRAMIGLSPLIVGIVAVTGLSYFITEILTGHNVFVFPQGLTMNPASPAGRHELLTIIFSYLLFTISSSMFPSKPDTKGTPAVFITLGLFFLAAWAVGLRIGLTGYALELTLRIVNSLVKSLGIVLVVNFVSFLVLHLLIVLIGKLTRRKIIS